MNRRLANCRGQHLILASVLAVLCCRPVTLAAPPEVTGSLETVQGVRVLKLWGTAEESGYAHGYLLGADIMEVFEGVILDPEVIEDPRQYETDIRRKYVRQMRLDPDRRAELEGMLRGVIAAVGVQGTHLERVGRNLDVHDLMAANYFADWARLGCSSFSAWGEAAADGGMITARNLDFMVLPALEAKPLIIVYLDPGSGRQPWVSLAWPSLIGAYTAMNEQGVTVSMHYGPGREPTHTGAFVPTPLALREVVETAGPVSVVTDARRALASLPSKFGYNVHVSSPFANQPNPAGVLEYDGDLSKDGGVTPRFSTAPPLKDWIVCTNHYCRRGTPPADPESSSVARYTTIEKALTEARRQHRKIDLAFAREVIGSVAVRGTLQSVVFLPNRKELHVSLARPGTPAHLVQPVHFRLADLLRK